MNLLKDTRERHGFTQQDVADLMGVPRPNVARWESGTQLPRIDTALRLAAILGTRPDKLWMLVEDESWSGRSTAS